MSGQSAASPEPSPIEAWLPASVLALRNNYGFDDFRRDLVSGITVGLVALPLAMAFAISSGVLPQAGIYCAIVTGFLISALGGSRFQIGGPTGAFVVVVAGVIAKYGLDGLLMATMMAGVMMLVLGATGLGTAVKFIPQPVVVGFTNGIAVTIASTQLRDLFGIRVASVPGEFLPRLQTLIGAASTWSPAATALGVGTFIFLVVWKKLGIRVPGYIVALFAGTILVTVAGIPVETIGDRFGRIPSNLPSVVIPTFRPDLMQIGRAHV